MRVLRRFFNEYLFRTGRVEEYVNANGNKQMMIMGEFFADIVSIRAPELSDRRINPNQHRAFLISSEIDELSDIEVRTSKIVMKYNGKKVI